MYINVSKKEIFGTKSLPKKGFSEGLKGGSKRFHREFQKISKGDKKKFVYKTRSVLYTKMVCVRIRKRFVFVYEIFCNSQSFTFQPWTLPS